MPMPKGKRIRSVRPLKDVLIGAGAVGAAAIGAGMNDDLGFAVNDGMSAIKVPAVREVKPDTIIEIQFDADVADVNPIAYEGGDPASAEAGVALSPFEYELIYGPRLQSGVSVTASLLSTHVSKTELADVVTNAASAIQPFSTRSQIGAHIGIALDRPDMRRKLACRRVPTASRSDSMARSTARNGPCFGTRPRANEVPVGTLASTPSTPARRPPGACCAFFASMCKGRSPKC